MPDAGVRAVTDRVRALTAAHPAPVVLVDGRSGAGKTALARAVAARTGIAVLPLESVYPGWQGLEAASRMLRDDVLVPRATGRAARIRSWDWRRGASGPWLEVPPGPLLVEGVGALTAANRRLAHLGVWVELDAPERRRRALARDGATYEPEWCGWAEQEHRFGSRERPRTLADLEVAG